MESITTCKVCFLNYDTKDHTPRSLLCGHTICSNCLASMLSNPTLRKCPFDNAVFAPSQNSLASFALNYIVIDMLEEKKNNTCKTHLDEKSKLICLTDNKKICSECAKHEDHKDHDIKKIKTLKAQGAKVKRELQQSLLNIKEYELAKDKDCEQTRKIFVRTITEQFKEIKEILVEKEFELVQQANFLFDADKKNDMEGTFSWKQQIDETIKDITHACQDENGDMMRLDKEVRNNDQNNTKRRTEFLKEKSSRVEKTALEMQNSLKEALVSSKMAINSLQLSDQKFVKEIYSVQEDLGQLSPEELTRRQKKLKSVKFRSHFYLVEVKGCLVISAQFPQPQEIEINLADFKAIKTVEIQLDQYGTLREDPIPSVLSYIFHGLKNFLDLRVFFGPQNFSNDSLWWLGETIRNHVHHLKRIRLSLVDCKFNDGSMPVLCEMIFSQAVNLQSLTLNLGSCEVIDADLLLLAQSLKPSHKNLTCFAIGLKNDEISNIGVDEVLKLIQSMEKLEELQLDLQGLKQLSNETFEILAESVLPSLPSLKSLYLWLIGSSISDEAISLVLKNLPNLKNLTIDLSKTAVTSKTLEMFIEEVFPRLKALESFSFIADETRINKNYLEKIQKISEKFKKKNNPTETEKRE